MSINYIVLAVTDGRGSGIFSSSRLISEVAAVIIFVEIRVSIVCISSKKLQIEWYFQRKNTYVCGCSSDNGCFNKSSYNIALAVTDVGSSRCFSNSRLISVGMAVIIAVLIRESRVFYWQ